MYAVKSPEDFSVMMGRMMRAQMKAQQVTVTYMKPEYDRPRVRTWKIADIYTSEDGHILILAWDSYYDEIRTFRADRVTHYTRHRTKYSVMDLSDMIADKAEHSSSPEENEDADVRIEDKWEQAAAAAAGASDWFECRGLQYMADRLWENAEFAWRMVTSPAGDGAVSTG